jgi:ABC-type Fe3+/spermidine/putrescine transport system ATPase subunit
MGSIYWNGSDLKSMPIETLREKMAVVFQDFARFPATVQENKSDSIGVRIYPEGNGNELRSPLPSPELSRLNC